MLFVNGSSTIEQSGTDVILISPVGFEVKQALNIPLLHNNLFPFWIVGLLLRNIPIAITKCGIPDPWPLKIVVTIFPRNK